MDLSCRPFCLAITLTDTLMITIMIIVKKMTWSLDLWRSLALINGGEEGDCEPSSDAPDSPLSGPGGHGQNSSPTHHQVSPSVAARRKVFRKSRKKSSTRSLRSSPSPGKWPGNTELGGRKRGPCPLEFLDHWKQVCFLKTHYWRLCQLFWQCPGISAARVTHLKVFSVCPNIWWLEAFLHRIIAL